MMSGAVATAAAAAAAPKHMKLYMGFVLMVPWLGVWEKIASGKFANHIAAGVTSNWDSEAPSSEL